VIDWHHPRIYERLRCFGLSLFTLGLASHNEGNAPAALAAIVVTILLVIRLKIELDIRRYEDASTLERKLERIHQINRAVLVPVSVGVFALLRQMAAGEELAPFWRKNN
jgi:hypothetical protein